MLSEPEPESVADDCELNNAVLVEDCRIEFAVNPPLADVRKPLPVDDEIEVNERRRVVSPVPRSLVLEALEPVSLVRVELRFVLPTVTVVVTVTRPVAFRPVAASGVTPPAVRVVTCVIVVVDVGVVKLKLSRCPLPALVLLPFKVTIVVENTKAVAILAVPIHILSQYSESIFSTLTRKCCGHWQSRSQSRNFTTGRNFVGFCIMVID